MRRWTLLLVRASSPVLGGLYRRRAWRRIVSWFENHGVTEGDLMGFLTSLNGKLRNYRTYVSLGIPALVASLQFLTGEIGAEAVSAALEPVVKPLWYAGVTAALGFLRAGSKNDAKAAVEAIVNGGAKPAKP